MTAFSKYDRISTKQIYKDIYDTEMEIRVRQDQIVDKILFLD